jgi:hypothetical protein
MNLGNRLNYDNFSIENLLYNYFFNILYLLNNMKLILLFLILACSTHSDSPVTTVELGKIYNI